MIILYILFNALFFCNYHSFNQALERLNPADWLCHALNIFPLSFELHENSPDYDVECPPSLLEEINQRRFALSAASGARHVMD